MGMYNPSMTQVLRAEDLVQYRAYVVSTCKRLVGDPNIAEELAQDTLAIAVEKLPEFRGEASPRTWLFRIARNVCFNAIRKKGELITDDGVLDPEDVEREVYTSLRQFERDALIRAAAANALDPIEQEVVVLRYTEQLPYDRITALLQLEGSGARAVLQRCRRKLRAEIRRMLDELGHGTSFLRLTQR